MRWWVVAILASLPTLAVAQTMTKVPIDQQNVVFCDQYESLVQGAAAEGTLINRSEQNQSYQRPSAILRGDIASFENVSTIEVDTWGPKLGNAFAMIVCRATLVFTNGTRLQGAYAVETPLAFGGPVVSWFPAE